MTLTNNVDTILIILSMLHNDDLYHIMLVNNTIYQISLTNHLWYQKIKLKYKNLPLKYNLHYKLLYKKFYNISDIITYAIDNLDDHILEWLRIYHLDNYKDCFFYNICKYIQNINDPKCSKLDKKLYINNLLKYIDVNIILFNNLYIKSRYALYYKLRDMVQNEDYKDVALMYMNKYFLNDNN